MKLLHTSDWHLGKWLYGRKCHDEFKAFLQWLTNEVEKQKIDCLLIAGDIFDNTTPPNSVLQLYYSFLYDISRTSCRHVIIIGGNHDSPSLLNAPKKLLEQLHVSVIGEAMENPTDEVLSLYDDQGKRELVVCAVPYLRDRNVRKSQPGETIDEKAENLIKGIAGHYTDVIDQAEKIRKSEGGNVPLVVMGHLFTSGGKVADNNEIRDLYVGSLAHVHGSIFPENVDYLALGHLHICQRVDGADNKRYCGSPLQLSFGKNQQKKYVLVVNLSSEVQVEQQEVPPFLSLTSIEGDAEDITAQITSLVNEDRKVLLEVVHTGPRNPALHGELLSLIKDSSVEILRFMNRDLADKHSTPMVAKENLDDLSPLDVFRKCMLTHEIEPVVRREMEARFQEIMEEIHEGEDL